MKAESLERAGNTFASFQNKCTLLLDKSKQTQKKYAYGSIQLDIQF